ncbi:hypothetical protein AMECASPLE_014606 [Ameca splendens]|uniref:HECT domain-containing protein n=1 Tax=Ameca splendens TaxID=208324 RepID=A0ABV0XER8_9TELE
MQQWQRQKKTSPKSRLKVTFFGEAGIDTGALSREFLTEMLAEVENRLFVGGSDKKGKNPVYCLNSLDSNFFGVIPMLDPDAEPAQKKPSTLTYQKS